MAANIVRRADGTFLETATQEALDVAWRDLGKLARQVTRMDRGPFRALLAEILSAAPSVESVRKQAERYPDRYVQALTQLGKLAGYREVTEHRLTVEVSTMSDVELEQRVRSLEHDLARMRGDEQDAEFEDVSGPPTA
jgi:hypothetical protein